MKTIIIAALTCLILSGCTGEKEQEKTLLDDVIKIHDKVMQADDKLMTNKMELDTLLKQNNLPERGRAVLLRSRLIMADSGMYRWMNKFKVDYKGKTDDETIGYLINQKKQIVAIDSLFHKFINESDKYLLKIKTK